MKVLLNNNLLETPLPVDPDNRALQYGDGIFETIRFTSGRIPLLDYHLERLQRGIDLLNLDVHPNRFRYLADNLDALRQFNIPDTDDCIGKLMVWRRGSETPGYGPTSDKADTLLTVRPRNFSEKPVKLGISLDSVVSTSPWSTAKTLNSLPYVMAARECRESTYDDLTIQNPAGEVAEAISSNIFAYFNNAWHTPLLASGCVGGVMRKYILDNPWSSPCIESVLHPDMLHKAEGIVLTAATGCRIVSNFDGYDLDVDLSGKWIEEIHTSIDQKA